MPSSRRTIFVPSTSAHSLAKAVARGYTIVKLHEIGAAEIAAAREAIGADIVLTVDASCAWPLPQAIDMAKKLRPYDLTWLEEPLWPPEDYAGMAQLKAEGGGMPIAAGENAGTLTDIARNLSISQASITFSPASPR